jgi:hypothetical protein
MEQREYQAFYFSCTLTCNRTKSLRLQMYKGMGFEPVLNQEGIVYKMLVRKLFFIKRFPQIKWSMQVRSQEMYIVSNSTMASQTTSMPSFCGDWHHHKGPLLFYCPICIGSTLEKTVVADCYVSPTCLFCMLHLALSACQNQKIYLQ